MLDSLLFTRAGVRRPGTRSILPLALAACSGGDLFLPDDPDDRAPTQLVVVSGDGQSAVAGSPVPHPLVVKALDRADRAVEGAVIVFRFVDQPEGAAIAPSSSETDSSGRASVEVTLGRPAGDQPVDAHLADPDHDVRVRFLLTAIRSNTGGGGGGGGAGGGDEEDGRGGKGKGKGKGHRGDGGNNDGGGDEDD